MEELSGISAVAGTNVSKEVSDCNSSSLLMISGNKRGKQENNTASSTATRYKGVIVQPNGHWGAQIYAHDRIWLGTFKSQVEAAMAYDSATIKLRNGDSHRNFPWTSVTIEEPKFQSQFSTEAVLTMIKDGSYSIKFADYLRNKSTPQGGQISASVTPVTVGLVSQKLFQKELTPSDVGKLNRLVIPKKYAMMHFPQISRSVLENDAKGVVDDTEVEFLDSSMRSWKFRYCYWKSSQSFVFTRGWNRFVRDKGLRAKDMVIFSFGEFKNGSTEMRSVFMIDAGYHGHCQTDLEENDGCAVHDQVESSNGSVVPKKGLRLFGVQIIS